MLKLRAAHLCERASPRPEVRTMHDGKEEVRYHLWEENGFDAPYLTQIDEKTGAPLETVNQTVTVLDDVPVKPRLQRLLPLFQQ